MKPRPLSVVLLTCAALFAYSGLRLAGTVAELSSLDFGKRGLRSPRPLILGRPPGAAIDAKTATAGSTQFGARSPDAGLPAETLTTASSDTRPTAEPVLATTRVDNTGDDSQTREELRDALETALAQDPGFTDLLDRSDPEVRAKILELLPAASR